MVRLAKMIALATLGGTVLHVVSTLYRMSSASATQSPPPPPIASPSPPSPPPAIATATTPLTQPSPPPSPTPRASRLPRKAEIARVVSGSAICLGTQLPKILRFKCDGARAATAAADEAADAAALQSALHALQHPPNCDSAATSRPAYTFKDWRNGLGAQINTLVGVWAAILHREASATAPLFGPRAPLLIPLGGLRYANKALCPKRDLSCYFEPFSACEPLPSARKARAAKTPPELAERVTTELKLRRPRDKWWLRKELTRFVFRPNARTRTMLAAVREEMSLLPPSTSGGATGGGSGKAAGGLRTDQLVGIHIRRGDKRDLGAKERGEPFSDAMYVKAALALADELNAAGFLLASSEPETLRRLPALLKPRPTFVMPAKYFVQVPEGLTPHQVIERTKQEGGGNDEGRSQIVQLLLLAECQGFLGTATSNFGLLVTKLMAFHVPTPVAVDLSCAGLSAMQAGADEQVPVWSLAWDARDAKRCKGLCRHEDVRARRRPP